ncbi:hypothetical protein AALD01_04710 [Oscillospiraceae bacterium 21-37]
MLKYILTYLLIGFLFEGLIVIGYLKNKVQFTKAEMIIGGIIDILLWPFVILITMFGSDAGR